VSAVLPEAVDITERRRSEEALRQSQKMDAVGQLTGGVAHDFNNLLTIIRSATDFLRRRELSEDRRRRYIDAISDTVDRASKLTGQLLAFSRRQILSPRPLDPEAVVIGGGVAQIGRPLFRKIKETIPHYTINRSFAAKTPLLPAKLQKQVGVFGAASLFLPAGEEAEGEC